MNGAPLALLQISDTAFPIGAASHSGGLEGLVAAGEVTDLPSLAQYSRFYLRESFGKIDLPGCLLAFTSGREWDSVQEGPNGEQKKAAEINIATLDARLRALKLGSEGREASRMFGRRLLQNLETSAYFQDSVLAWYQEGLKQNQLFGHYCLAFGLAGATFGVTAEETGYAFCLNALSALLGSAQRLLPLGQRSMQHLLWSLHPLIEEEVGQAQTLKFFELGSFNPGLDIASFQHTQQTTRLFMS